MTLAQRRINGKVSQFGEKKSAGRTENDRRLGENARERGASGDRNKRPPLSEQTLHRIAQNEREPGEEHG